MFPAGIICRTEDGVKLTFEIREETLEWALTPAQGNLEGRERLMNCFDEEISRVLLQMGGVGVGGAEQGIHGWFTVE